MKKIFLTILILVLGVIAMAEETNLKWIDALEIGISGRNHIHDGYFRLTEENRAKMKPVNENVYNLSTNSAGLHFDFTTDASEIYLEYELLNPYFMDHMAITGSAGVDTYVKQDGKWVYLNTVRIDDIKALKIKSLIFSRNTEVILGKQKDITFSLNFPLYNGVKSFKIGINKDASFTPILYRDKKPVVVYGSSITQGGCASRPGMAYTNILRRNIDRDVYNLGFSGNGVLEHEMAEILCEYDPEILIMDCVANMLPLDLDVFTERFDYFYKIYRQAHPTTPIIFMEAPTFTGIWAREKEMPKNKDLKGFFNEWKKKDKNIYYIATDRLYGDDHESAVDGTHATDLGFYRMSQPVIETVKSILKTLN